MASFPDFSRATSLASFPKFRVIGGLLLLRPGPPPSSAIVGIAAVSDTIGADDRAEPEKSGRASARQAQRRSRKTAGGARATPLRAASA